MTVRFKVWLGVGMVAALALVSPAEAEPVSVERQAEPSAAKSTEVVLPAAPRPEQVEPMVAPVKRVAPSMPDNKAKAATHSKKPSLVERVSKSSTAKLSAKTADKSEPKRKR